jgi:hypothetical protein
MKYRIIIEAKGNECVETMAKRKYWALVDGYMQSNIEDEETETKIEMLRIFLEQMEPVKYRSEMEERMARGEKVCLVLELDLEPKKEEVAVRIEAM